MREFADIDAFCAEVGRPLGDSPWFTVDQQHIDLFAEATGDHQWIHVDPVRAAEGPFGSTIAHGYLTLSLVPVLLQQTFSIAAITALMNYGADRIRFPRPVPAGARVQARATLTGVEEVPLGVRAQVHVEVHLEDGGKPAVVADLITLLVR